MLFLGPFIAPFIWWYRYFKNGEYEPLDEFDIFD